MRRGFALALLLGGIHFTFHLFMRLVPPLVPVLAVELGYPLWQLGSLVGVYFAGSSVGLLPMGVCSDRYDRRGLLTGALLVVSLGYLLFASVPTVGPGVPSVSVAGQGLDGSFLLMLAAMFVSGVGTSAHVPVGVPLLTANVAEADRGTMLGIWGGSSKVGDAVAPALVGVLIISYSWDTILFGFGVGGVVAAGLLFVVLGLDRFETSPPATTDDTPAVDVDLLADRRRYLYPMLALVGYFAMYNVAVQGVVTFTPSFVADVYGYTGAFGSLAVGAESFADFVLSALLVSAAVSRFAGGVVADRFDYRTVLVGSLTVAAGALFVVASASLGPVALVAVLVVFGGGLWGNSPARDSLISDLTPAEREGRTFSYLYTSSRAFGALSPVAVGFVADTAGFRFGFELLAGATLLAAGFVALLYSERVYVGDASSGAAASD
ncbi:MAG: MFS transporter [Haloferacaceae archaeon]